MAGTRRVLPLAEVLPGVNLMVELDKKTKKKLSFVGSASQEPSWRSPAE